MKKFRYAAMDARGREIEGSIDAETESSAISQIKNKGLFPTSVSELKDVKDFVNEMFLPRPRPIEKPIFKRHFGSATNSRDISLLMNDLGNLVDVGMPLLRAVHVLSKSEKNKRMASVLEQIGNDIESGSTFAEALANHPKIFDTVCTNMIRAGEAAGALHTALFRLGEGINKNYAINQKIFNIRLGVTAIVVLLGMAAIILPPAPTSYILIMLLACGISSTLLIRATCIKWWDTMVLRTPYIGTALADYEIGSIMRLFAMLLTGGVPILQAINIVRDGCRTSVFYDAMNVIHDYVKEGDSLVDGMDRCGVFPPMVRSMMMVGEETGSLPECLTKLADMYEKKLLS